MKIILQSERNIKSLGLAQGSLGIADKYTAKLWRGGMLIAYIFILTGIIKKMCYNHVNILFLVEEIIYYLRSKNA